MRFNSYIFIFVFLPIVLIGFHLVGKRGLHRIAISWLVGASLFFYGWWNPIYLVLILASIIFNYSAGAFLREKPSKVALAFGIIVNLSLLGYFKYAIFFMTNFNVLTGGNIYLDQIVLPLAISFFTFQQITYIVDAYRGSTERYKFLYYCLFVTFFPQLIAGPIVHHKEMLSQFANNMLYKVKAYHLSVGITIFLLGLFKKVVFADTIAIYATPVFKAAENGIALTFFEAWAGALAYTLQIYFDFSGYSDMAIGIARMFGIMLPVNFYSPYQANSIIDFWRKWHITLSRFLRDYLYIPLGGNRKGRARRYTNLMITMLLGGFWHGAGWTFIIWGGMHGMFLLINHAWKATITKIFPHRNRKSFIAIISRRSITFIAVVIAWVMFRSENLAGAVGMYYGMFAYNGMSLPTWLESRTGDFCEKLKMIGFNFNGMFHNGVLGDSKNGIVLLIFLMSIVLFCPNTLDWLRNENPALGLNVFLTKQRLKLFWKPNILTAIFIAFVALVSIMFIQQKSDFLYFQF